MSVACSPIGTHRAAFPHHTCANRREHPFVARHWRAARGRVGDSARRDDRQCRSPALRSELIAQRFPTTLALTGASILLSLVIGVPLGVVSATRRDGMTDNVGRLLSIIDVSIPVFWLGFLLILAFAIGIPVFPPGGSVSEYGPIALVLPSVTLGASFAGIVVRFTRAAMLEVLGEDYIRT